MYGLPGAQESELRAFVLWCSLSNLSLPLLIKDGNWLRRAWNYAATQSL